VAGPRHPSLYQINTRVWLDELGAEHGRSATLEDVPDSALDEIVADGFDWVWLLGLSQTDEAGRQVSLHQYQRRSARFLENHDEPRAAAVFPPAVHEAAAALAFLAPGLRFIHDGQVEGRRLRASNHLRRRAPEPVNHELQSYYDRLLMCMRRPEVRDGDWRLLDLGPAWQGNPTWDEFVAFAWSGAGGRLLVAANYGPTQGQCYFRLPDQGLAGRTIVLRDLMKPSTVYERDVNELDGRGLYLDLPAWGYHIFDVTTPQ
jgi:hypothetical protein